MATIEVRGGVLRFVGGKVDGLEVKVESNFQRLSRLRNRSFAQMPGGRIELGSFLTEEREDEERYQKEMEIS